MCAPPCNFKVSCSKPRNTSYFRNKFSPIVCTVDGVNCMENPLHHFSIIDEPKHLLSNASLINSIVAPNSFLRLLSAKVIQAKRGLLHFQRITALLFKFGISWKSNKAKYWHISAVCVLCITTTYKNSNFCKIFYTFMKLVVATE